MKNSGFSLLDRYEFWYIRLSKDPNDKLQLADHGHFEYEVRTVSTLFRDIRMLFNLEIKPAWWYVWSTKSPIETSNANVKVYRIRSRLDISYVNIRTERVGSKQEYYQTSCPYSFTQKGGEVYVRCICLTWRRIDWQKCIFYASFLLCFLKNIVHSVHLFCVCFRRMENQWQETHKEDRIDRKERDALVDLAYPYMTKQRKNEYKGRKKWERELDMWLCRTHIITQLIIIRFFL